MGFARRTLPACAGMTVMGFARRTLPAFAGMTIAGASAERRFRPAFVIGCGRGVACEARRSSNEEARR